jgi:hypothetical protein
LIVYAFANVGAFAAAAWLVRDKNSDDIDDLNGLGFQQPLLAVSILILMLSLIGIPPLAGFFGKLYVFMEALNQPPSKQPVSLIYLVALGLLNSVVSAFYYVRVLKAMFLRPPGEQRLAPASRAIAAPIVLGAIVVVIFGVMPGSLMSIMEAAAEPMLTQPIEVPKLDPPKNTPQRPQLTIPEGAPIQHPPTVGGPAASQKKSYTPQEQEAMKSRGAGGRAPRGGGGAPGKKAAGKAKTGSGASPAPGKGAPAKANPGPGAGTSRGGPAPAGVRAVAMKAE